MKRVFIIQNTPLNEPLPLSVYLTDLLKNFKKSEEFEVNLIVSESKEIPIEIKNLCRGIYQFNSSTYSIKDNIKFSFFVNRILKKENKSKRIDIIHCFYPNSSLLGAVIFKRFSGKNVKIIYDVRSPWIEMSIERGFIPRFIAPIYKKVLYFEEKRLCKYVDDFIFITEGLKDYYTKKCGIKNKSIFVSSSGVDTKLFRKTKTNIRKVHNIKKDEILIGSVGGIAKIRRLNDFLPIFKGVLKENPHVKLMFIGEGDALEDLKKEAQHLKLTENIIFTGKIPHQEVPKYISTFNFGLCHLPNIFVYENSFPLKILEYLACGVPVLASNLKAHREISKNLNNVFIYSSQKDIEDTLKKKIFKKNPSLEEYSWYNLIKQYEKTWEY